MFLKHIAENAINYNKQTMSTALLCLSKNTRIRV